VIQKLSEILEDLARTAYQGLIPVKGHELCPSCGGTGFANNDPCPCCDATGDVYVDNEVPIKQHRARHCNNESCNHVDELGYCACGCPDCRAADEKLSNKNEEEYDG